MAKREEKKRSRLNRYYQSKTQITPHRKPLELMETASEIRACLPGIKREISSYVKQLDGKQNFPPQKISEFRDRLERLERKYKAHCRRAEALDPAGQALRGRPGERHKYIRKELLAKVGGELPRTLPSTSSPAPLPYYYTPDEDRARQATAAHQRLYLQGAGEAYRVQQEENERQTQSQSSHSQSQSHPQAHSQSAGKANPVQQETERRESQQPPSQFQGRGPSGDRVGQVPAWHDLNDPRREGGEEAAGCLDLLDYSDEEDNEETDRLISHDA